MENEINNIVEDLKKISRGNGNIGKPIFVKDERYFLQIKREVLRDYLEMSYLYEKTSKRTLA